MSPSALQIKSYTIQGLKNWHVICNIASIRHCEDKLWMYW